MDRFASLATDGADRRTERRPALRDNGGRTGALGFMAAKASRFFNSSRQWL